MTGAHVLFWIFAAGTCFGAVAVVVSQHIVRMAFWLMVSLGSAAGLFFLLHADFVAATQLLIYVGGTVVLLIFGVMLTASGPFMHIKTSPGEGLVAAVVGGLFLAMLASTVVAVDWDAARDKLAASSEQSPADETYNRPEVGNTVRPLGLALLGLRPDKDLGKTSESTSTGYLLPFEIASIHLLVVLIGAAYLARAKRRVDATTETR